MTFAAVSSRTRRHLVEWGFLLAILLTFGIYIAYSQYQDYLRIDTQERQHLTLQVASLNELNDLLSGRYAMRRGLPSV